MSEARAIKVECSGDSFSVQLCDGRTVTVPYFCYPILDAVEPAKRVDVEIYSNGRMLHWPNCAEDIEVAHLLAGKMPRKLYMKYGTVIPTQGMVSAPGYPALD